MGRLEIKSKACNVWGCPAEVSIYNPQEKKLDPRTVDILLAMQENLRDTDFIIFLVQREL